MSLLRGAAAGFRRRSQHGLTAVELMIVLVVVALLALGAYPYLSNLREVMLVKGAAEQTTAAIRLARQLAITQGANHCIEFANEQATPTYSKYRIKTDTGNSCDGTVVSGYDWQSLADPRFGAIVTTAPTLVFDPIGTRTLPTGTGNTTFTVSASSCTSTISVTLYGGVRVAGC